MQINFKSNVEEVIERLNLSKSDVAYSVDMTKHQYRMTLGYNAPLVQTVNKLAQALGVAPSELILGPSERIKGFEKPLDVSSNVKKILKRKGIDKKELSKRMGWNGRGSAHHFFKNNNPRIMKLPELAKALGVELSELVM